MSFGSASLFIYIALTAGNAALVLMGAGLAALAGAASTYYAVKKCDISS